MSSGTRSEGREDGVDGVEVERAEEAEWCHRREHEPGQGSVPSSGQGAWVTELGVRVTKLGAWEHRA